MAPAPRPAVERFLEKVEIDANGCWLWTASRFGNGYASFGIATSRSRGAHRWAYEHFVGPIPAELEIDHLCGVRHCVNPAHLEAVTHAENVRRGGATNGDRCSRGHEYRRSAAQRRKVCRECRNEQQRMRRAIVG